MSVHKYLVWKIKGVIRCSIYTVIWLYFVVKIFRTLLFRAVFIAYAPHILYETRVKISLLNNKDGSVRN